MPRLITLLLALFLSLVTSAICAAPRWAPVPDDEVTLGGERERHPTPGRERVPRARFTRDIDEREPVDRLEEVPNTLPRIYYFTELRGLLGRTISHRWEYQGRLMAEVQHQVETYRWRAWSSKRLLPQWLGEWSVSVVDEEGNVLRRDTFNVVEAKE